MYACDCTPCHENEITSARGYTVFGCQSLNEQLLLGLKCYYPGFEAKGHGDVVWRDILLLVRGELNATFCWCCQCPNDIVVHMEMTGIYTFQ